MDGDQTKQKKCAYVFDEEIIQKKNKLNREFINIFYVFVHNFSIFFFVLYLKLTTFIGKLIICLI